MNNKLSCYREWQLRLTNLRAAFLVLGAILCIVTPRPAFAAASAPDWLRAAASAPLPAHDEKTDAVLVYSEESINVVSADKVKKQVRMAYKILRPAARAEYGWAGVSFNPHRKVTRLHGWCIPAQGNVYEVKEKDATTIAIPKIDGSELISDVKLMMLQLPAADPGNVVGFEYETEEQPFVLQAEWRFQGSVPSVERRFSLQLPAGWEYKAVWLNHPEVKPVQGGSNQWQWTVSDVKAIRHEADMPPLAGVAGQLIVSFFPAGGAVVNGFSTWQQMGNWYTNLTTGRRDSSPEIKQTVATLTASAKTPLEKMRILAGFVQDNIRYVAIELGVGGLQPHSAAEVFVHRYGDCKDKATLLSTMLHEIGVESYYVVINGERGAVTRDTPAHTGAFDHMILAIKLPEGVSDSSLIATMQDPKLGKLLFFDPTNELTPFGQIGGYLQQNYGLLVSPEGGELVELPSQPATMNGVQRKAQLTLDGNGTLKGDITEVRIGDRARQERRALRDVSKDTEMIAPIEHVVADSMTNYHILNARAVNLHHNDQPFGFVYTVEAPNYAKSAGNLLLVRPRVVGSKASRAFDTKDPRLYPFEFSAPLHDSDTFEITLPAGYEVDELPLPVDADFGFATYHSKTEISGSAIRYTRTFEVKELSVPVSNFDNVLKLNRVISNDERQMAVLKPKAK